MARKISVELLGNSASLERAFSRSGHSAKTFERDLSRSGRGIAAVGLGFAGLGRSLAFASGAFIGAAGIAEGFKLSVEGAQSFEKAQQSVRTVLQRTGQDVGKLTPEYLATAKAAANLGVSQATALGGLATATTLTGNAASAMRAYVEALNISKATHKSFSSVLTATAKGQEGITTSLQRYGIEIKKGTSGTAQFATVMKRFGGQAEANTTNLDRLKASAANLAEQIGGPLLGVLDRVAGKLTGVAADISAFFSRIGQAHTFQAKVQVVVSGLESVARGLTSAIGSAVAGIDWNAVWSNARGVADGLQKRLDQINWGGVGSAIGKGIAKGVAGAGAAFKELAGRVEKAFNSIDFVALGVKLGPALAGAVASAFATLTDPSFWLHHWQLALSVALVAFGDGIGKIAVKFVPLMDGLVLAILRPIEKLSPRLAGALLNAFTDVGGVIEDGVLKIASGIERVAPRLARAFLSGILALPRLVARILQPITNVVERVFAKLGRVSRFVVKVLGVDAAIHVVSRAVSRLSDLIGHGLDVAWNAMEHAALVAALKIVEPFSHLPGFLGGGPFQQMKAALQKQLDGMDRAAKNTAASIKASLAGVAVDLGATVNSIFRTQDKAAGKKPAPRAGSQLGTTGGNVPSPATASAVTGFTLPFRLQLAQAKASATATIKDDLQVAREIRAFILQAIPHLHGKKLIDAYNQLGQINQEIAADVKQAAKKAKQAITSFTLPPKLTLALARDAALGLDPTKDLLKAKAAILKFIRTHKHNIQALTDAYNQLASINQQLSSTTSSALGGFKQASTKALTADLGLTAAQRKALRARLSQLGPGGTVPGQGVGAGGFIIDPTTGKPIKGDQAGRAARASSQQTADKVLRLLASGHAFRNEIHLTVEIDGKKVSSSVSRHQHRKRDRNPTQRRGPNAATSTA